ncbi:MAG: hypothetical protein P8M25_06010 [Paracoccaceae bacterium]|nr:hypothetical protein [Paracoccaceae bacterium]
MINLDKRKDYGLKQAHKLINMAKAFVESKFEIAYIWAVQHKNATTFLSGSEGAE